MLIHARPDHAATVASSKGSTGACASTSTPTQGRLAVAERVADDLEQTLVAMNQQTFAVLR